MRRPTFHLLALAAVAAVRAAGPAWPPLNGELSGNLTLPQLADVPSLAWHVNARSARDGALALDLSATAPGLALRIAVTPPAGAAPGAWRVVSGKVDVASWWHVAAAHANAKSLPPDLELAGALEATGAGPWRGGADFSGIVDATLTAGTARSAAQSWEVTGLVLTANVVLRSGGATLRSAQLRAETVTAAGLVAKNLLIEIAAGDGGRLVVQRAEIAALGGRIALAPFTLDPAAPAVKTTAEFTGLALTDLAALVPQALTEASGQIAGRIAVSWSLQSGFEPGTGSLDVSAGEAATLRLAKSPGMLTGHSQPRIEFLPAWAGPLRNWLSVENPSYDVLRRIELGELPLAVERLAVQLYPDGPEGAHSARVEVAARPTSGDAVKLVTFTVNVNGPLAQVLRLGMDDRAKVRVNAPR